VSRRQQQQQQQQPPVLNFELCTALAVRCSPHVAWRCKSSRWLFSDVVGVSDGLSLHAHAMLQVLLLQSLPCAGSIPVSGKWLLVIWGKHSASLRAS